MTEQNLRNMAQAARHADADVVIVGMQIPPNYGRDYTQRFAQLFPTVAKDEKPGSSLPDGRHCDERAMFQADGIHPNEDAQPQLLDNVWPALRPLLNPGVSPPRRAARPDGVGRSRQHLHLYCSRSMRTTASFSAWP